MSTIAWIAAGFFVFGYVLIALEQRFNTHKSAIALIMGGVLWTLAAAAGRGTEAFTDVTNETAVNVFSIVAFSLASMALIEILAHYRFFDFVRAQLLRLKVRDKGQFVLMLALCFMLSGVLDNISLTIAMIQVARRFFTGTNLVLAAAGVVIASNAGGAWSPIGDVTSLLLWMGGKIGALDLITTAFLPTAALVLTAGYLLYRKLDPTNFVKHENDEKMELSLSEKVVIGSALFAFILPLLVNVIGVQPYTGRLLGLGITWALIELARTKSRKPHQSHLTANIEKIVQTIDMSSIKFIMGILLSVGALTSLGVLAYLSSVAVGDNPSQEWIIGLGSLLGLLSGVVDNSALVAIAMEVFPATTDPRIWGLIAITTGTGGSLLIFASAAGIVAMGSLKELTFQTYLKLATVPALAGLAVAVAVWFLQYQLFWS